MDEHIVIRQAVPADRAAVRRVAGRDSRRPPAGELLVAERAGVIRAYLSLERGDHGADPFHRTAELVDLLSLRAEQLRVCGAWSPADPAAHLASSMQPGAGRVAA